MDLTWTVIAAVLFGALLHAGWNALLKAGTDQPLDTATMKLVGSLAALPAALLVGLPPAPAWPFLLASVTVHIGYFATLSGAYRHGDLGLTYPLMRGSAPLLVALTSTLVLGETLVPLAWAGVLAVAAGVVAMGLSRQALEAPRAVAFALANAVVITCYTVVDALGVRAAGDPLQYVCTLFVLNGWPYSLIVFSQRGWRPSWAHLRRHAPRGLLGACASFGAYGIALWAMTRAPVASVAALRETSVLFAALIGLVLLREPFTLRRIVATATILAGVVALRLA